ncbi:unnamed protein product [Microthlaspi erraticum]|uniref:Uncharacterized protein n=1 Tax=Microthlaspi erraticum TaxID=1685480 RepID=A0A6D2JK04_9BRAS|nr:unnamed protein product [Microthlaspi erraticum]
MFRHTKAVEWIGDAETLPLDTATLITVADLQAAIAGALKQFTVGMKEQLAEVCFEQQKINDQLTCPPRTHQLFLETLEPQTIRQESNLNGPVADEAIQRIWKQPLVPNLEAASSAELTELRQAFKRLESQAIYLYFKCFY